MATRTTTTSAPAAPTTSNIASPTPKVRSYKDFLTPAMHRRFTQATFATLLLCYVEAIFMSESGFLWRMLPFGMTGIRTLLLFMPCLGVFIIRLANLHVGERNTTAGYETFYQLVRAPRSWFTLLWYTYSACFFGEVYIWSRGQGANLGWVDVGKEYERPRVNENPILLRSLFVVLAAAQTCMHLYFDYDLVRIPENEEAVPDKAADAPEQFPKPLLEIKAKLPSMLQWALKVTTGGVVAISPIYFLLFRRRAWSWCDTIARVFFSDLPKDAAPTGIIYLPGLAWQCATSTFMLSVLWELSNAVFTASVAQPPLKKSFPLTNEVKDASGIILSKSVDPNGSLLTGLKSKREIPKTFAFWELHIISTSYPTRRKTLFTDVDRADAPTWSQVSTACLAEIDAIRTRIRTCLEPAEGRAAVAQAEKTRQQQEDLIATQQQGALELPKIANRGVQDANVFASQTQPSTFSHSFGSVAKSMGQHPNAPNPISPGPRGKQLLTWGTDKVLTKAQRAQLNRQGFNSKATSYALSFLQTPLGAPFRETFARQVRVVVFGIPHSNRINIIHAVRALTALLLASLNEDTLGVVGKGVPTVIRSLTATIKEIRAFVAGLEPNWTDVDFDGNKRVEDVEEIVVEMKRCLEKLLLAFGEYASGLGLSKKEVREAKEVAGAGG